MQSIIVEDNRVLDKNLTQDALNSLLPFAGVSIKDLCKKHKSLLIFPQCLGVNKDDIGTNTLFDIYGCKLKANNSMGFWGVKGVNVQIHSRFDNHKKQFFFHYMLQKVLGINVISLTTGINEDNLWDFLIYLFPCCLKNAIKQGLFRSYQHFSYNDNRVRGTIDISRNIKNNIPFNGKIAYNAREYSTDNILMHLIRHTIEFIALHKQKGNIFTLDSEIQQAVTQVKSATPSYQATERQRVIGKNLRPQRHPYLIEYTFLQQLCLRILRYEKINFGNDDNQIYGIVFDGAWLWEEYIATILNKQGFIHPNNKTGINKQHLYYKGGVIYPDFWHENKKIVIDTKYKMLDDKFNREDRFQIISYMHVLKCTYGYALYPTITEIGKTEKELKGYGGFLGKIPFKIPQNCNSEDEFKESIQKNELEIPKF